jgi:hypothetical protein
LPSGRGTTAVTSDHDGVASAAGDAAAVDAAAELNPGAKESVISWPQKDGAQTAVLAIRQRHHSRH